MDAAMRLLAQQTEPGCIEMEHRERQQQRRHDPCAAHSERTESHFGVELALELSRFGVVDLQAQAIPRDGGGWGSGHRLHRPLLDEAFFLVELLGTGMERYSQPGQGRIEPDRPALGMTRVEQLAGIWVP